MRIQISQKELIKPLQLVCNVADRKQTMQVLGNILFQVNNGSIKLTGTDSEVQIESTLVADVDTEGQTTIPANKIISICKNLASNASIKLEAEGHKAVLRTGRSRFSLATLPAEDFPSLDKFDSLFEITLPQKNLKEVIEKTSFAMAHQDVRFFLNGLMLEFTNQNLKAVAADGHRLAYSETDLESGPVEEHQIIIPRKGVIELQRLLENSDDNVTLNVSSNHIVVTFSDSLVFTCKLLDGKFPDYSNIIPAMMKQEVFIPRENLAQALTRASILSNDKYKGVRFNVNEDGVVIRAQNPEQEEAEEHIVVPFQGAAIETGFNVNYVMDAINVFSCDSVTFGFAEANATCVIKDPDDASTKMIVMPMRF